MCYLVLGWRLLVGEKMKADSNSSTDEIRGIQPDQWGTNVKNSMAQIKMLYTGRRTGIGYQLKAFLIVLYQPYTIPLQDVEYHISMAEKSVRQHTRAVQGDEYECIYPYKCISQRL